MGITICDRCINTKIIYRVDTYTGDGRFDIKLTKNSGSDYRCICVFNASYESQTDNNISSLNWNLRLFVMLARTTENVP